QRYLDSPVKSRDRLSICMASRRPLFGNRERRLMLACGAVDRIPHLRELPCRDAALVVDEVFVELDAESGPIQIALQEYVALGHHERLLDVALSQRAALYVGRSSFHRLKRWNLMGKEIRNRGRNVH